jgi:ferredoxin
MQTFKNILIYYFSGTGNSANVAGWISEAAGKGKIETAIYNIANIDRLTIPTPPENSLIVFVSPVHGFNYPPVMLHFIARFPKGKNKILLMNTRAGMLIKNFITPGWSGITFYLAAAILKLKGYNIKGMIPVDLPSNWISLHPGLNDRTVKYLHEKNKERVLKNIEKILNGKSNFIALREIIQDILISPIAIMYYFIGRFLLSKTFYASAECDNCDACIKSCPVKAIKKVDNRPFWTFNCESCMHCMSYCPRKAIETSHGFTIGFILLYSPVILAFIYKYTASISFKIENEVINSIIESAIFLGLFGFSYRVIHYLMRFGFIKKIMAYTSLTKYKFWGKRYRALKNY